MTKIHLPLRKILAACALLVPWHNLAAGPAASEAQGAVVLKLTAGATSEAGSSLTAPPVARGLVQEVSANVIFVAGAPFTAGAWAIPSAPHALRLTSGLQKGRLLRVQQNSVHSATLDTSGLSLDDSESKVKPGDRFEILPLDTLGSRFGRTIATVKVTAGAAEPTADLVQVWNGNEWASYYFSTAVNPARWVPTVNPTADAGDLVLTPDTALKIVRRGGARQLVLNGRVPPVRILFRALESSDNSLGAPFPVSLPVTQLAFGGPAVWGRSNTPETADKVRLRNGASDLSLYQDAAGVWRNAASPSTNLTGVALQPSGLLWVQNIGAISAKPWFTLNAPYPDQVGPMEPPPVVTPPQPIPPSLKVAGSKSISSKAKSKMVRGTASSSRSRVSRVEYRIHPSKKYRPASGTTGWSFKAKLRPGKNIFYVRAIDANGMASTPVKITIKRK